jgi:hypothetical protein
MVNVTEGVYRISLDGGHFLTALNDELIVLVPDGDMGSQRWEIRRVGDGYTLGQPGTNKYAAYDDDPSFGEPVTLRSQKRQWAIADGLRDNTVTFGVPGDAPERLTLGLSPLLIYPPRVALSPPYRQDEGWTLHPEA